MSGGGRDYSDAVKLFQNRRRELGDRIPTHAVGESGWTGESLRFERGFSFAQWRPPIARRLLDSERSRGGAAYRAAGTLLPVVSRLRRTAAVVNRPDQPGQSEDERKRRQR